MITARISEQDGWCRCGQCGRKLFKILDRKIFRDLPFIEIKCHSCKEINLVDGGRDHVR